MIQYELVLFTIFCARVTLQLLPSLVQSIYTIKYDPHIPYLYWAETSRLFFVVAKINNNRVSPSLDVDAFFAEIQRCTNVAPLDVPRAEIEGDDSYLEGYLILQKTPQ